MQLALECSHSATASLQKDLQVDTARLTAAEEKVFDLQEQLKTAQHQLSAKEVEDDSDTLSALKAQHLKDHITRMEQGREELQQRVRLLELNEVSLTRTIEELSHRAYMLETHVVILQVDLSKAREEAIDSQSSSHKVQEELENSELECELQHALLQLDTNVRTFTEKQSQHESILRQAKQAFL